jgi:hypothetical protein
MALTGVHNQAAGRVGIQHCLQSWEITGSGIMYGGWRQKYLEKCRLKSMTKGDRFIWLAKKSVPFGAADSPGDRV